MTLIPEGKRDMLKRIYINNFRCFSNFELETDAMNLFLGPNGVGKSTIFDVLRKLRHFINADEKIATLFSPQDLTHWDKSLKQAFELEIRGNGGIYKYELAIEHNEIRPSTRVHCERLWFDNKPLLNFEDGKARIFGDDHSEGPTYPFDSFNSLISSLPPRHDNTRLTWFRERMSRFIIVQLNPMMMPGTSNREESQLDVRAENFVSWYRHISQNQGTTADIASDLKELMEGFRYFRFAKTGEEQHLLHLYFSKEKDGRDGIEYRFDKISDGQRALIALYSIIHHAKYQDYTLCIDEPENFLALPEIQPWLTRLWDLCSDSDLQALLISHHPEYINYLASSAGWWFYRGSNLPVRVKRITEDEEGVPISELVARGWIDE